MKKILLLSLALLSTLSFYSCKDDDMSIPEGASDRLFRPMFRNDNSTARAKMTLTTLLSPTTIRLTCIGMS